MDERQRFKEVFAHLGLAIYRGQVFEHNLVTALVLTELIPKLGGRPVNEPEWQRIALEFVTHHSKATLGCLLRRVKTIVDLPDDLEQLLAEGLCARNWVAHSFFADSRFDTDQNRYRAIGRLKECYDRIDAADTAFERLIKPVRERHGYTDEFVAQKATQFGDSTHDL